MEHYVLASIFNLGHDILLKKFEPKESPSIQVGQARRSQGR
jgi:hypothetical protein